MFLFDGFEDGDVNEWTTNNFEASTNRSNSGSWSGLATYNSGTNLNTIDDIQGYRPLSQRVNSGTFTISYYWNESSNGNGHSFGFEDSNGNPICALGSDNPQWLVFDGSWNTVDSGGADYGDWVYGEVTIDFDNNQFDYFISDQTSTKSVSGTYNFANNVSLDRVALRANSSNRYAYIQDNTDNNNIEVWIDDIEHDALVSAPSTPQNLTSSVSGDDISLNWDAVNWNGDRGYYEIYRAVSSGSSRSDYTSIATVQDGTTNYTDSSLNDGERYYYRVDANNSAGSSGLSNQTAETTSLPGPSNISASALGDDVTISWNDNSDNEDGFQIFRGTSSGSLSLLATVGSNTTSYSDNNLSDGERYYYRVESYTEHRSSSSGEVNALTGLPAPTSLSLNTGTEDQITISWSDNSDNEDGFEIFRGTSSGSLSSVATVGSNSTNYTDSGLADGERYYYRVESYTEHTASSSGEVSGVTVLPAPSSLSTASNTEDELDLSWTNNSDNEDGFEIFRGTSSGSLSSVTTVSAGSTAYTDTGLADGEKYFYRVESYTEHTASSSNEASEITILPAPSSLSTTTQGTDQIDLSWTDNSDNEGEFRIERDTGSGFSQITTVTSNTISYSDTGLESNSSYTYRVRAATVHTTSGYSNESTSTTDRFVVTESGNITTSVGVSTTSTETGTLLSQTLLTDSTASVNTLTETSTKLVGSSVTPTTTTTQSVFEQTISQAGADVTPTTTTVFTAGTTTRSTLITTISSGLASPITGNSDSTLTVDGSITDATGIVLSVDIDGFALGDAQITDANPSLLVADNLTTAASESVVTGSVASVQQNDEIGISRPNTVLTEGQASPLLPSEVGTLTVIPSFVSSVGTPTTVEEIITSLETGVITSASASTFGTNTTTTAQGEALIISATGTPSTAGTSGFQEITGQVTLNGIGVGGAVIYVIDTETDSIVGTETTDGNGEYLLTVPSEPLYHVTVQYDDGSEKYNALSKPYVD